MLFLICALLWALNKSVWKEPFYLGYSTFSEIDKVSHCLNYCFLVLVRLLCLSSSAYISCIESPPLFCTIGFFSALYFWLWSRKPYSQPSPLLLLSESQYPDALCLWVLLLISTEQEIVNKKILGNAISSTKFTKSS